MTKIINIIMDKKRKLCQEFNTSIQIINTNVEKIGKLKKSIKKMETHLITQKIYPYEYIWNLIYHKCYNNNKDTKIKIYHEPHLDTFLNKYIDINENFSIIAIYYDNGIRWFKLSDGNGWIIK